MLRELSLAVILVALMSSPLSRAAVYNVRPDGLGDFPTIQAAVDAAVPGDIITLEDGTFTGDGNRDITLRGKSLIVRSESGVPSRCVIACGGTFDDPHRGFIFDSGEDSNAVIADITVQGGYAAGDPPHCYGGAIFCSQSSPTFRNCVISQNHASTLFAARREWIEVEVRGGAMYLSGSSSRLTECTFSENVAELHPVGENDTPLMYVGPSASKAGRELDDVYLYFVFGGGVYCDSSDIVLTRCTFVDNEARLPQGSPYGGGLFFPRGEGSIDLVECRFEGNAAAGHWSGFSKGGGAYLAVVGATLTGCWFSDNSCNYQGGGVFGGDTFSRCTFENNRAVRGGGAYTGGDFTQCTFYGNTGWASGSAIGVRQLSTISVRSCILAFGNGGAISCDMWGGVDAECCDVYGNSGGDWSGCLEGQEGTDGNFSADPLFCREPGSPSYMLQADSPCATKGTVTCRQIGAWPVGCDQFSSPPHAVAALPHLRIDPDVSFSGSSCRISYRLEAAGEVRIVLVNVTGRVVRDLNEGVLPAGDHVFLWDGRDHRGQKLEAGVYWAQLTAGGRATARRVVIVK